MVDRLVFSPKAPLGAAVIPSGKRFIAWDTDDNDWLFDGKVFTIKDFVTQLGTIPGVLNDLMILQSTGHYDKNDVEVFEGQLLTCEATIWPGVGLVHYDADMAQYYVRLSDGYDVELYYYFYDGLGVESVGHILTNRELWKEEHE